jgi:exosortase A-associated hydrolase 1
MRFDETTLAFRCQDDWLYGILSRPEESCRRGVLVVVGGPQYRTGSHRQFTLLARSLAGNGIAAMRFDYRGMGDSQGAARNFENIEDDLRAAIDAFMAAVPRMRDVVLWGLCDGASAIAAYAASDPRVSGLVMLNPWVRTADGLAKTTLKHYYGDRLRDGDFWRQLINGKLNIRHSVRSMLSLMRTAFAPGVARQNQDSLPDRIYGGLRAFGGPVMVIIGGADLTGREFCDLARTTPEWKRLMASPRITQREISRADHTFSKRAWRDQVADWTCEWLLSW